MAIVVAIHVQAAVHLSPGPRRRRSSDRETLRISGAVDADIDDPEYERGHRTLKILRKGDKCIVIHWRPGTPTGARPVHRRADDQADLLGAKGESMDRDAAHRMVKRLAASRHDGPGITPPSRHPRRGHVPRRHLALNPIPGADHAEWR